jgi:hypothetical protein
MLWVHSDEGIEAMNILEIFTDLADTIREHLGIKVRYSVQIQMPGGGWRDLEQNWEGAKKVRFSVTKTVADARHWEKRYQDAVARNYGSPVKTRIVRQVTQFDVVA